MPLVYFAVASAAGIAAARAIPLPMELWAWWLLLPVGLFLIWRRDSTLRRAHFILLGFLLFALRYTLALPHIDEHHLASFNDRGTILLIGNVVEPPDVRDRATQVRLEVSRVRADDGWHDVAGVALVQVAREADVRYGDQIQIFAEPQTPPESEDFSYKDYLARQGIHSLVRVYGGVKILARDQGNPFFAALYAFKARALTTLYAIFPDPAASLLAGILLGVDSGIPRDLTDAFSQTNTAHIIAISGFNISILAGIFATLARRIVGPRRATIIVVLGLIAYTLLVGASASVVRAAIMGSLSVIALHYHRQNDALNALAAAALLMLAWSPFTLFDMGFQLSFLATLGLILYVTPLSSAFENFFARLTSSARAKQIVGVLNDSFIVTLAAQITTTPLIVFAFHRLSLVGLLTNFIVLPVQPQVMILGWGAMLVAMLVQSVGQVIAWVAWAFTEFTIVVVQTTAVLPFASLDVERFDTLMVVAYYALLLSASIFDWRGAVKSIQTHVPKPASTTPPLSKAPTFALGVALIAGMWMWNLVLTAPDGKLHVEFLDAGGASTFVRAPNGARVLIDGGVNPSAVVSALGERMPLWDRTLDVVVLTNADDDHLAGLVAVLERFEVKQIVQVTAPAKPSVAYTKWRDLIASKHTAYSTAQSGLQIALDRGLLLEILDVSVETVVVRLDAGYSSFLVADSTDTDFQSALCDAENVTSTVLVAPRKLAPEFFDAVNPQFAMVFDGASMRDKPSPDLLATIAPATILETSERGTIEMIVDGQSLKIKTEK